MVNLMRWNNRPWSIRTYLAIGVNVTLVVVALVFLVFDYRQSVNQQIAHKRVALAEEARVLLSAIELCSPDDLGETQQLINLACGRMQDSSSPGHHIAVRLDDDVLQAQAHHRASPAYLHAMEQATTTANGVAELNQEKIVVGVAGENELLVYVSEYVANVIAAIRFQLLMRFVGGVVVTIVMLVLINAILARVVIQPLERLSDSVRRIGTGELGLQAPAAGSRELQLVSESLNEMSRALAAVEHRRQTQMDKARKIQRNLQPDSFQPSGLRLYYHSQPADDVGGDFLDYCQTADGGLIVCVADITGHGVPAAMGAAMLKVLFDTATSQVKDPGEILGIMNRAFHRVALEGDFATAVVLAFPADRRRCHYASAGHEPIALLHTDGASELLESTGLILGIDPDEKVDVKHISLKPGTRIVVYTDGLVEAVSPANQQFSRERIVTVLEQQRDKSLEDLCRTLMETIETHVAGGEQRDDMTLLVLEILDNTKRPFPRHDGV